MLTKKQKNLLLFINKKLRSSGVSPSYEEMKQSLNLKSKSGTYNRYFKSNDELIQNTQQRISNQEKILKKQTEQYLLSFIENKKNNSGISSKEYKLINQFKELHKMAIRDEVTLNELLIQKRTLALKKAESPTPWEIITLPNTYDYPIAPRKSTEIPPILFLGFSLFFTISDFRLRMDGHRPPDPQSQKIYEKKSCDHLGPGFGTRGTGPRPGTRSQGPKGPQIHSEI